MESQLLFTITVIAFSSISISCHGKGTPEQCVYLLDMERNYLTVECSATAALNIVDKDGNALVAGRGSGQDNKTLVFHLHRSKVLSKHKDTKKASKKLINTSRLLRKVQKEYHTQMKALVNLTGLLHRGEQDVIRDLETLRRHELTSPLVREAVIEALQYQFNFLRMGFLTQNRQLIDLIRVSKRLTTTVIKTARGAHGIGESLDRRVDVMNEALNNITALMSMGDSPHLTI